MIDMTIQNEFQVLTLKISNNSFYVARDLDIESLDSPILTHINNYPQLEWRDVYKFIFQGTCGWTHLLSDKDQEQVVRYLSDELTKASKPLPEERLYEILNNYTKISRINLRVWKSKKLGQIHELWKLLEKSTASIPKTTNYFTREWLNLIDYIDNEMIILSEKDSYLVNEWLQLVTKLSEYTKESKFMPLIHHSEIYRQNYNPSYRLAKEDDIIDLMRHKGLDF